MNREEERKVWRRALELACRDAAEQYFAHRRHCQKCGDCGEALNDIDQPTPYRILERAATECGIALPAFEKLCAHGMDENQFCLECWHQKNKA